MSSPTLPNPPRFMGPMDQAPTTPEEWAAFYRWLLKAKTATNQSATALGTVQAQARALSDDVAAQGVQITSLTEDLATVPTKIDVSQAEAYTEAAGLALLMADGQGGGGSTGGLVLSGTHAERILNYPPLNYPPGTLFWETDRWVYYIDSPEGFLGYWVYSSGIYEDGYQSRPADMGAQAASIDKDFPFYAKDQQVLYRWDVDWYYATGVQDGAQSARPTNPGAHDAGLLYLETDIGPPLPLFWWSGTQWLQVGGGVAGAQGAPGTQGLAGAQGATGAGVQGPPGPQGPGGGAQGSQGVTGSQGPQGATGPQGVQGAGFQGPQGTQGHQGFQGQSIQGSQGYQGRQGYQGNQGATGNVGSPGQAGTPGTPGSPGPPGPPGSNANIIVNDAPLGGIDVLTNIAGPVTTYTPILSEHLVYDIQANNPTITTNSGAGTYWNWVKAINDDSHGNYQYVFGANMNIDPSLFPKGPAGPAGPAGPVGTTGSRGPAGVNSITVQGATGSFDVEDDSDTLENDMSGTWNSSTNVLSLSASGSRGHFCTADAVFDILESPDDSIHITQSGRYVGLEVSSSSSGAFSSPNNTILIAKQNGSITLDVNQNMMASRAWVQSNYATSGQLNSQIQDLQDQIDYLSRDLQELDANCCEYGLY